MNKIQDAHMSHNELKDIAEENAHEYIKSGFEFIRAHNGLRPGCVHLFLGTSGSGKSTVVRKIILDSADEHTILVWQSEETREDFVTSLVKSYPKPEVARNIKIVSEFGLGEDVVQSPQAVFQKYAETVKALNPRAVFFDNITTSRMYMGLRPNEQDAMAWKIKELHESTDIPVLIIAHTRADVTDSAARLIEDTDIRGSKSIANLAPYLYIFQRFEIDDHVFPTIRVRKSRKHQVANKLFRLIYSKEKNAYVKDLELPFKEFKEAFSKRNRL